MAVVKTIRVKKIDISKYFNENAWVTIKYINRDIWRYANRLTLKTIDTMIYQTIQSDKKIKQLEQQIDKLKNLNEDKERIQLKNELNNYITSKTTDLYNAFTKDKIEESAKIENERNKILIENGLDKDNHNLFDENNKKLLLSYEVVRELPFFDEILTEIIKYNGEFDMGEVRLA